MTNNPPPHAPNNPVIPISNPFSGCPDIKICVSSTRRTMLGRWLQKKGWIKKQFWEVSIVNSQLAMKMSDWHYVPVVTVYNRSIVIPV